MAEDKHSGVSDAELLHMASDIAAAYVSHNNLSAEQLPDVIKTVHATLSSVGRVPVEDRDNSKPAVPVRRSITPDYIVCLEDGKRLKMLKRHLRSAYNMTPDQYRAKWGASIGLSNGGAKLREAAVAIRQEDWAGTQGKGRRSRQRRLTSHLPSVQKTGRPTTPAGCFREIIRRTLRWMLLNPQ